jgi:MSHA biogenesis protein MshI
MRQQINLLQVALEDRKPVLPAKQIIAIIGAVLLLSAVGAGFTHWRASGPAAELLQARSELERARVTLSSLSALAATIVRDPELQLEQAGLERELAGLRRLSAATADPPGTVTLSGILAGAGRQRPEGLWLDLMHVSSSGDLVLRGKVLDASLLPDYISRLGRDQAFSGLRFAELELGRDGDHGRWLDFRVMAGCDSPECRSQVQVSR